MVTTKLKIEAWSRMGIDPKQTAEVSNLVFLRFFWCPVVYNFSY